jgi:hypothetical protein
MDDRQNTNVMWWAVPAATVLLLALLAMFGVGDPPVRPTPRSTYDASGVGARAAYLLLDSLGYKVAQSRLLTDGSVRWVLFPQERHSESTREDEEILKPKSGRRSAREDVAILERWVRDGGTLLLADEAGEFAGLLGIRVEASFDAATTPVIQGPRQPMKLAPGRTRITPRERPDRTWPERGEPLVSIFKRGRGEIWVVHCPEIFRNERIRDADNALAVTGLAEATSRHSERIYFDEFFHGMRERLGPVQLLLQPPVRWVTLQGLAALALVLWRFLPRFGPLREAPPARRRSKEEFLDAMAYLLIRKGAHVEAFRTVRDALIRDIGQALGLPANTPPDELAAQAVRRRPGLNEDRLSRALGRKKPADGRDGFLTAIHELESLRREFFHERNDR